MGYGDQAAEAKRLIKDMIDDLKDLQRFA